MSANMATILKLLTLCALAHSVCGLAIPKIYQTTTDPPAIRSPSDPGQRQYLVVSPDGQSPPGAVLLKEHQDERLLYQHLAPPDVAAVPLKPVEECSNPSHRAPFSAYDYTVLLSMLVISLGIGVFYGFLKKSGGSSNEFLLGSEMSLFPVTLSLTTSFITAIELLGNPSEMYFQGTQFVLIVIPMIGVIPVAVKVFYPIYFKMELTSCYEYLGIRFGKEIRIFGAILYIVQMCFYTAVAVLAPAIALSKATGLDTTIAVILVYVVCVFYSSQGGMNAVVIADSFQAAVLALSLVLIVGLGSFYSGTPLQIFTSAADRNRLEFFNFDFNPTTRHTVWSVVIGGFFYWTSLFCTNQASVQKCMSLKSLKLAKVALGFAILGLVVVFLMNFYTGLMVFNHYLDCDPLTAGRITAKDQLLPFYIISTYEHIPTIAGIFVAGIFAASLGTVASALNSLSAVTCEDLLVNGINIKITPDKGALYAKWMSLGFGVVSFGLVFIVARLGGVLQATLTLNGLIGGVTLGLFVLGIAFKQANTKGALYGGILSLVIVTVVGVIAQIVNVEPRSLRLSTDRCDCLINATQTMQYQDLGQSSASSLWSLFEISYMWYSMIGTLFTILLGLAISVVINAIQKHNVLKINSAHPDHNVSLTLERRRKHVPATPVTVSITTSADSLEKSSTTTETAIATEEATAVEEGTATEVETATEVRPTTKVASTTEVPPATEAAPTTEAAPMTTVAPTTEVVPTTEAAPTAEIAKATTTETEAEEGAGAEEGVEAEAASGCHINHAIRLDDE